MSLTKRAYSLVPVLVPREVSYKLCKRAVVALIVVSLVQFLCSLIGTLRHAELGSLLFKSNILLITRYLIAM